MVDESVKLNFSAVSGLAYPKEMLWCIQAMLKHSVGPVETCAKSLCSKYYTALFLRRTNLMNVFEIVACVSFRVRRKLIM